MGRALASVTAYSRAGDSMTFRTLVIAAQLSCLPGCVAIAEDPSFDEDAALARVRNFEELGFVRVTSEGTMSGVSENPIEIWVSPEDVDDYLRIRPDTTGSMAELRRGATVVRKVLAKDGTLMRTTAVTVGPEMLNPAAGGLWFAVLDNNGRIMEEEGTPQLGALPKCTSCHQTRAVDGFLFGAPAE